MGLPGGNKQLSVGSKQLSVVGDRGRLRANEMVLPLDPNDPEAEERARRAVEDAGQRRIARALAETRAELDALILDGALTPGEMQALLTRYGNRFDEVMAEAMRRAGREARSVELQEAHRYAIGRTIEEGAEAGLSVAFGQLGNVGLNLSYGPVNRFAVEWAQQYTFDLVSRIDESTGRQLGNAVAGWIQRGDALPALVRDLEPLFGPVRAEMIASTETTRAFTEGTLIGYRQSGVVVGIEWRTAQDERVCPICRPLHGERGNMDAETVHPGARSEDARQRALEARHGGLTFRPPAHVRCRCIIAPIVDEGAAARVTSQPPAPATPEPTGLQYQPSAEQTARAVGKVDKQIGFVAERNGTTAQQVERVIGTTVNRLVAENPVAVNFHAENIDALLKDGRFKSQFETMKSGAILNPQARVNSENLGLGAPENLAAKQRPIYGYLRAGANSEKIGFGNVTFVVKDEVKRRATFTVGDSLYDFAGGESVGTPMVAPGKASWGTRVSWLYDFATGQAGLDQTLERVRYLEVQMQGGVSLADVSHVIDRNGVLTQAQIEQLEARGIKRWTSD